ncbi:hypothetical protein ILUMI_05961 [Ignelater luminosus]|uniref:Sanpodo n=1 Tax=Ignelater luminosus TaxID=2038154 RepID=A0A8K0GI76_IGNLU|nr:hypothetical protein ILUMI_05961 [Ignelater luminosus]
MANSDNQQNYYSNPAFCQQSEFYNYSLCKSPGKSLSPQRNQSQTWIRQSPVGAQSPVRVSDNNSQNVRDLPPKPGPKPAKYISNNEQYQEQDFYEEMIVDDTGFVKQKKIVIVSSSNDNKNGNSRYACVPQNDNQIQQQNNGNRYAVIPSVIDEDLSRNHVTNQKNRYEYIQIQKQDTNHNQPISKNDYHEEEFELGNRRVHRYAVIPAEEETELTSSNKGRYDACSENSTQNYRYAVVPRYQKPNQQRRYEYIDSIQDNYEQSPRRVQEERCVQNGNNSQLLNRVTSPKAVRKPANPYATQKLYELLSTPPKSYQIQHSQTPQKVTSPHSPRKPITPSSTDPFITPRKTPHKVMREKTPKAQQKLNYALSTRQTAQDKRHTAIVTPICSSPVQSVYSETTYSNKSESWMNLSGNKQPVHVTLTVAAVMMLLCGGLTSCLCFYMVSVMGRLYFLDFGIVSGFACLVLGLLGFRSRNHYYWLPNRNYISGYIILTLCSLLTCVGLLVLLFMQPKPGSPLADMTSGAVCGISVLSLILATAGVMTSYCCKLPPPDNRVEHCARGFTV